MGTPGVAAFTAGGCRHMEGLEVLSSRRQVSQGLWITWGNIDYLVFLCYTVFPLFSLCSIVKTTYVIVAGG